MVIHYTLALALDGQAYRAQQDCQSFFPHFDQVHGTSNPNRYTVHDHLNHKPFAQHAAIGKYFQISGSVSFIGKIHFNH